MHSLLWPPRWSAPPEVISSSSDKNPISIFLFSLPLMPTGRFCFPWRISFSRRSSRIRIDSGRTTREKVRSALDKLSNQILKDKLRGVFAVSSVFTITGVDRPFKDYFRFSVMDFLDNTHRNKNLFTVFYVYSLEAGGPDMERFLSTGACHRFRLIFL